MIRLLPLLLLALASPALAQTKPASKEPLEVTALQSLEWHQNEKFYIARGKAVAKQGTAELRGDTLTARYTETGKAKDMNISRIEADGNVTIVSNGSTATGQQGYYDMQRGYSELTGNNLKLTTATDTVTARDKITYDANANQMNALGDARAVRGDDVITANQLIARFQKGADGKSEMKEMEAIGNVVITTPTDVMHGDRGIYYAASNKATITGNVRIDRGPNVITGARGEVDMNTNISRIFGAGAPTATGDGDSLAPATGSGDGRVRGVFFPDSQETKTP